jgi:hypothetical protein
VQIFHALRSFRLAFPIPAQENLFLVHAHAPFPSASGLRVLLARGIVGRQEADQDRNGGPYHHEDADAGNGD